MGVNNIQIEKVILTMEDIQVDELKERLDTNDHAIILIDVREPHEHEEFSVGGTLIPLGSLPENLESLNQYQDKEIVVYCRSGARSGRAKAFMEQAGFDNVRNLLGGVMSWIDKYGV